MDERDAILVIDDDVGTRTTLALILKKKGFDVITAGTGEEGLKQAQGRMVAVALLDINLPDVEGIRLIAPLKEMHPDLAVIMITGFASMENAMRALNEGAASYILKPINIEEILAKIDDAFERQRLVKNKELAEEALRISEEKFRNLVENITDIIYSMDEHGTFTYISPAVEKISGYLPSEVTGKNFSLFIFQDDLPGVMRAFETVCAGNSITFTFRIVTKSGEIRWLNSSNQPVILDGSESGSQGVISDITERKQAEDALMMARDELEMRVRKRTAELTRANANLEAEIAERRRAEKELIGKKDEISAANEQLAATEAELRYNYNELSRSQQALSQARNKLNILNTVTFQDIQNAIFSLSGYLELEKQLPMDEKLKQYLGKQVEIVRAISDSLKFTRLYQDLGQNPPVWQNVDQSFLLAISHLDLSNLSRQIRIRGLDIYADPLLENVFFTLAENVVLHGKTATEIAFRYQESPEGLNLIFEDNGKGIPSGMKEKIFDRHYEEKKGLGLFLVREILSVTGITIRETGEPGKGTRFEITVPKGTYRFRKKADAPEGNFNHDQYVFGQMRIL